jgi:hypothetical protein
MRRGEIMDALHEDIYAFLLATRAYLSLYFPVRKICDRKVVERKINTNFTAINFLTDLEAIT